MSAPLFLEIESSSPDEGAYPIAVCWSLESGEIKSVLVMPDEDWEPYEHVHYSKDIDLCFDQGVTASDILREMEEDLSGHSVFSGNIDETSQMLDVLYQSLNQEPVFELHGLEALTSRLQNPYDQLSEVIRNHDLDPENAEQRLLADLYLAREEGLI